MSRELNVMREINSQLKDFIRLQEEAKGKAKAAAAATKAAANKQTVVMKALGLQYDKNNKIFDGTGRRVNQMGQEVNRAGEIVSNFNKRSTVLTKTIEELNKSGKSFEVTSKRSFQVYKEQGGNVFEYLAEAISGTREEITLFGQEGAKIRKVMYGFLPPGTFRALNKMSSVLQAVGSATRRNSRSTADYTKDIDNLKKAQKGLSTDDDKYKDLQEAINKKREEMLSGNSILGTAMKAFGKIPRLGKHRKSMAWEEAGIENRNRDRVQDNLFGSSYDINSARERRDELKTKSSFISGISGNNSNNARTQDEETLLQGLNEALAPLDSTKGKAANYLEAAIANGPLVGMLKGVQSMMGKIGFLLVKVFSKESWGKIKEAAKMGMKFMFSLMIYITMFFVLVYLFRNPLLNMAKRVGEFIQTTWPKFKENMSMAFGLIRDGFMDIYNGFKDGDLVRILMGVWEIVGGVLYGLWTLTKAVFAVAWEALKGFVAGILDNVFNFLFKGKTDFMSIIKKVAIGIGVIATILIGWPAIIVLAIGAGMLALGRLLKEKLPFFANGGTVTNDGMQVVGERGPELVSLPKGSRVHSNRDSRKMTSGTVNNFNITVNAKDSSKAEMRRMADEIGRMINSKINRSTSSSTLR
jgi:hypothetical protein